MGISKPPRRAFSQLMQLTQSVVFNRRPCHLLGAASFPYRTQKRTFASYVQASLSEEDFFNREREIQGLTSMLRAEPQLSIVSGPVNSGKTALILKILDDLSQNNNRPVLHLNLRKRSFDTVNEFASSLDRDMHSWLDPFGEVAKRLKLDTSGYGFKLQPSLETRKTPKATPIDRLDWETQCSISRHE
eukprot:Filipodium_phascolosomae@DN2795_c0_g3_i8.p1